MFTEIETSDDFKCSRFTLNLNFDDQSCEPIVQKAFQINFPKDKCRKLKSQIFEEHEMSFEQFTQFDTITDLDFLKRELLDFSEDLLIKDEENFTRYFIENLPSEEERIKDSLFQIYAKLVSKYYSNLNEVCQIIQACVPNLLDRYYIDVFIAICMNRPFNYQWEIIFQKYHDQEIETNDFLKASNGLIKNSIFPPELEDFISILISKPISGIFKVLKQLNLTREKIVSFEIDFLLIDALDNKDPKITADALYFIAVDRNLFLLQNEIIVEKIFNILELGNYKQKEKVVIFFYNIMGLIPRELVALFIEKELIEGVGEMIYSSSLEVQFSSLKIIRFCIDIEKSNWFGIDYNIMDRCHKPEIYDTIAELANSGTKEISNMAIEVINELDNVTNERMRF